MEVSRYMMLIGVILCAGYILPPVEGAGEIPQSTKLQLNQKISNYLLSFNKLKKLMTGEDKKSMYVVEKLIVLTWIETLNPEISHVSPAMPLPNDAGGIQDVVEDIKARLKDIDESVVEAAVVHYMKNVHWQLADEMLGITTVTADTYNNVPKLNTENYRVHMKYSNKMYLRAFALNYAPIPLGKTFLLKDVVEQIEIPVNSYSTTDLMSLYAD